MSDKLQPTNTLNMVCEHTTLAMQKDRNSPNLYASAARGCARHEVLRLSKVPKSNFIEEKGAFAIELGKMIHEWYYKNLCKALAEADAKKPEDERRLAIEEVPLYMKLEGMDHLISGRMDILFPLRWEKAKHDAIMEYLETVNAIKKAAYEKQNAAATEADSEERTKAKAAESKDEEKKKQMIADMVVHAAEKVKLQAEADELWSRLPQVKLPDFGNYQIVEVKSAYGYGMRAMRKEGPRDSAVAQIGMYLWFTKSKGVGAAAAEIPVLARDNTDRLQFFIDLLRMGDKRPGTVEIREGDLFVGDRRMMEMEELLAHYRYIDTCLRDRKLPDIPYPVKRNPDGSYSETAYKDRKVGNVWNCKPQYCSHSDVCLRDIGGQTMPVDAQPSLLK